MTNDLQETDALTRRSMLKVMGAGLALAGFSGCAQEPEEKIVNEKNNTGSRAFTRLFTELTSGLKFRMEESGPEITMSEVLAHVYEADRDLRRRAYEVLFTELERHGQVLSFVGRGMCRQDNQRYRGSFRISFQHSGGFAAVDFRQADVHQNQVGSLLLCLVNSIPSVNGNDYLKVSFLQSPREHVAD